MTFADYILEKIRLATDLPKCIAPIIGEYFFDNQPVMVAKPMDTEITISTFNRTTGNKEMTKNGIEDASTRYGKLKLLNMVGSQLYQIYIAFKEKLYDYLEIVFSRFLSGFEMLSEEHIGYGMCMFYLSRAFDDLECVKTQEIDFHYNVSAKRNCQITENTMVYFPQYIMVPAWCLQKYTA